MKKKWVVNETAYPNGDIDINIFNPLEKDPCYQHSSLCRVFRHTQNHGDWRDRSREEVRMFASMIATAPEMYDALKNVILTMSQTNDFVLIEAMVKLAAEAIAKAEGRKYE